MWKYCRAPCCWEQLNHLKRGSAWQRWARRCNLKSSRRIMIAQFCLVSYLRLKCFSVPPFWFGYICQNGRQRGTAFSLFALLRQNQRDVVLLRWWEPANTTNHTRNIQFTGKYRWDSGFYNLVIRVFTVLSEGRRPGVEHCFLPERQWNLWCIQIGKVSRRSQMNKPESLNDRRTTSRKETDQLSFRLLAFLLATC